jgi:hypothetical protein
VGDYDEVVQAQKALLWRQQALEFFGPSEFRERVKDKELIRVGTSLYRLAGAPITDRQQLLAATMCYGGPAGFRGAGALHTFDRYEFARAEIILPSGVGSRGGLKYAKTTIHRSNFLPETHLTVVDGIATTNAARTICDLSVYLSSASLGKLLDSAVRRDIVTINEVADVREDLRGRGRRRTTVIDELLDDRGLGFHPGGSNPEKNLRRWLDHAGMPPETQFRVIVAGTPRSLDLAYPRERVAVEYQGLDVHGMPSRVVDDARRTTELQLAGWLVVLITKKTGRLRALQMVREALAARGRTFSS